MRAIKILGISLVLILCFFSCQKESELKTKRVAPETMIERYNDALRWSLYDQAKNFLMPEAQTEFDEFIKGIKGKLNIIDYAIVSIELSPEGMLLQCRVRRSFYTVSSMRQEEKELEQTWRLVNGVWLLSGPPF